MTYQKKIVYAGFFLALALVLPGAFHMIGGLAAGQMFLPMHIPVLTAGFILGPVYGLLVGIVAPLLSGAVTGMPVLFPIGIIMSGELACYGFVAGFLHRQAGKGVYLSLAAAMVSGRIIAGIIAALLIANAGALIPSAPLYLKGAVLTGLPGLLLQLVFIPPLVKVLEKRN